MTALMLDALAAYRLARLVTTDTLLHDARESIVRASYVAAGRAEAVEDTRQTLAKNGVTLSWTEIAHEDEPEAPKLATLITCRWCTGVWVGFGVVVVRRFRWWPFFRDALALGAVAALLARAEQD